MQYVEFTTEDLISYSEGKIINEKCSDELDYIVKILRTVPASIMYERKHYVLLSFKLNNYWINMFNNIFKYSTVHYNRGGE